MITALYLDGPKALTTTQGNWGPVIRAPIPKQPTVIGVHSLDADKVAMEYIDYYCVAIGFERKVALYSISRGDRSLLNIKLPDEVIHSI